MEEEKKECPPQETAAFDPTAPVIPDAPDPDDTPYDDGPGYINWKERLYDRIPSKKVPGVLRMLDILIPVLLVAIVVLIFLGSR